MSGQWHPDTEAIASLRAGLTGGLRGRRVARHVAGCARCASVGDELAAVSAALASVPVPVLPEAFELQITAALAAEAAARSDAVGSAVGSAAGAAVGAPRVGSAADGAGGAAREAGGAARHRSRHARAPGRERSFRFRPAMAFAPVVVLVLVGFGFLLSRANLSSSSSSAPMLSEPAARAAGSAEASASAAAGSSRIPAAAPAPGNGHAISRTPGRFFVIASGTAYEASSLRDQVSTVINTVNSVKSAPSAAPTALPVPSASQSPQTGTQYAASSGTGGSAPSAALVGCALHLTGNVTPSLVDKATYQGKPAYVIAVAHHIWVVGLGCTSSNPDVIASVPLG